MGDYESFRRAFSKGFKESSCRNRRLLFKMTNGDQLVGKLSRYDLDEDSPMSTDLDEVLSTIAYRGGTLLLKLDSGVETLVFESGICSVQQIEIE